MSGPSFLLVLLTATAALRFVSEKLDVPHTALLVLGGLLLAAAPGLPRATLDPDVAFLVFVPPLLYSAALTTSWRDFRLSLRPIVALGIGLVCVTMLAVAAVAHALVGMSWAPAFVLGAIVSPPDVVAAVDVMRRLSVTRAIRTVLRGEGLLNDAAALVAYRMAVNATVSGGVSTREVALQLLASGTGGILIGLAVGYAVVLLRRRLPPLTEAQTTISLLTPFAAFIPAERLGLSGVLAVVAVGLYVSHQAPRFIPPEGRLQILDVWATVTFILDGLLFILIGLDLPFAVSAVSDRGFSSLVWFAAAVSAAVILVRIAWVFPAAYLRQAIERWLNSRTVVVTTREIFLIAWTGIRGADSLVIALALPMTTAAGQPFPERGAIVFVTFVVILVTLVLQGLALRPIIRLLGLHADPLRTDESIEARLRTARAGLARLDEIMMREPKLAEAARHLKLHHRHRVHQYAARKDHRIHQRDETAAADYRTVRREMIDAERREAIRLRDESVIGDDVMHALERELDLEELQLKVESSDRD